MVKNKPNRPLNRLINHFNKDAPTSDTQHLTISPWSFGAAQKTLRKPIQDTFVIWPLLSPFARADLLRGGHGLAVPSHQGTPTVSLQHQHRRQRRALSLRRDTWARDARLDGIGPAHEARYPARGSLRAQRDRSDLDCAQTAARPRALNDGLWLRTANFGGHTAQD
jgi:hypothetical protein